MVCRNLFAAGIVLGTAVCSLAQSGYPNRPIQLVVPVPPGGAADFIARTVGAKLADALGQSVVINNRGGAGGTIASAGVAKAEADGYTLLLNSITTHGIGPHIHASLPYDPVKDFLPIILVAKLPLIMTVNAMVPAKSVPEVIALAKAQ
jgi:tripartite-type tricarboxylate transporter receptor subunit TctC